VIVAALVALAAPTTALAHGDEEHHDVPKIVRIVGGSDIDVATTDEGRLELTAPAGKLVIVNGYSKEPFLKFERGKVYANARATAAPRWVEQHDGLTHAWHDHRTAAENWIVDGTVNGKPFAIVGTLAREESGGVGYQWISYIAIGGFLCYLGFILVTRMLARR